MPLLSSSRPALAASLLLAGLAGAYELATRGPGSPAAPPRAAPTPTRPAAVAALAQRPEQAPAADAGAALTTASPAPGPEPPARADIRPPEDETVHCPPAPPLRFRRHPAVAMPRRYVGTVGGQPATAEVEVAGGTLGSGSFYLWRGGPAYELHHTVVLTPLHGRIVSTAGQYLAGSWHLARPAGRVLAGYWQDAAGRRHPFVLHESYAQAVRYELQALTLWGGPSGADYTCLVPHYKRDYLQLLGAVSPALRRQQAPPLARRRRQMRASFPAAEDCEYEVQVRLNGFNLLSYQTVYSSSPFGGRQQYSQTGTLIDLATGRTRTLASQLRPHYELALRHLLAQHLLHDAEYDYLNKGSTGTWLWADSTRIRADTTANKSRWTWRPYAPFSPQDATVFTGEGLEVNYWLGSLSSAGNTDLGVLIPYAELRPLVRPGTPLARMLQARGLW